MQTKHYTCPDCATVCSPDYEDDIDDGLTYTDSEFFCPRCRRVFSKSASVSFRKPKVLLEPQSRDDKDLSEIFNIDVIHKLLDSGVLETGKNTVSQRLRDKVKAFIESGGKKYILSTIELGRVSAMLAVDEIQRQCPEIGSDWTDDDKGATLDFGLRLPNYSYPVQVDSKVGTIFDPTPTANQIRIMVDELINGRDSAIMNVSLNNDATLKGVRLFSFKNDLHGSEMVAVLTSEAYKQIRDLMPHWILKQYRPLGVVTSWNGKGINLGVFGTEL